MAVKVQFEIGHTSKLRSKKTAEGFTHDWELYVQGVNKADISVFVEKVVFNLHDSFPKPKRAFKEPPYVLKESGYAGFLLPIDIYFRNRDEPKRVQFTYDLDLQHAGPPQHRSDIKKFIFENPSEDFRQKLMKGGGIAVSGVISGNCSTPTAVSAVEEGGMVNKPKLSSDSGKKHKPRSDDSKLSTFANLFGTPITKSTTKYSPDAKSGGKNITNTGGASAAASSCATGGGGTPSANVTNASSTATKDKSGKEKDKPGAGGLLGSGNTEKIRDKSEKKEKHKQISPNQETRSADNKKSSMEGPSKHDKRGEEKPKKDKSRDKDRDRSREKINSGAGTKRSLSPKSGSRNIGAGPSSPKRITPPRSSSSASGRAEEVIKVAKADVAPEANSKSSKSVKEQSSSTSGKKSKKDKKEKDREKEKDKISDHKDKHRLETKTKEERSSNTAVNNTNTAEKETKPSPAANEAGKKLEKSPKAEAEKLPVNKSAEKSTEKEAAIGPNTFTNNVSSNGNLSATDKKSSTSASVEKDKKSHKHKKKDKSKDKDKEKDKDKDKVKLRDKDKDKEKEKEKNHPKEQDKPDAVASTADAAFKTEPGGIQATSVNTTAVTTTTVTSSNTISASTPVQPTSTSKKSQNKEKRSKDKANKMDKHSHDENNKNSASNKHVKNTASSAASSATAPLSTASTNNAAPNANVDLSDVENDKQTSSELPAAPAAANASTNSTPSTHAHHSDNSNSSFPDLAAKSSSSSSVLLPPPAAPGATVMTTAAVSARLSEATHAPVKDLRNTKEHKQGRAEKTSASTAPATKTGEKQDSLKKRRRNSAAVNTFIEPPLKQVKKDANKPIREKSKSPSVRSSGRRSSSSSAESNTFLHPPSANNTNAPNSSVGGPVCSTAVAADGSTIAASPGTHATATSSSNDATANNNSTNNVTSAVTPCQNSNNNKNSVQTATSAAAATTTAAALPTEYLTELQELHHKIMTLQDNDELQHVVELIAATGCYEITAKTFDFDLCKLDRSTVQRLQEFFAASVS